MRSIIYLLVFFLFSCNDKNKIIKTNKYEPNKVAINKHFLNRVYPKGNYAPEYPLVAFYYDKNISKLNKWGKAFPKEINDLVVDTLENHLIISFDYEGDLSCELNGQIHLTWINKKENDTVYLDYFKNCNGIENSSKSNTRIRLYYEFTDVLSYKKKIFIPRSKY